MGSKIVIRTLLLLGVWLVSQNFNVLPPEKPHHRQVMPSVQTGGKSRDSFLSATSILQKHLATSGYQVKTVVLDAGHGGKDPGCSGVSGTHEKHNALAIILQLGALIEEHFPEIKVIYTRKEDVFIELNERAAIANRNHADVFISVHCNSMSVSSAKGTETYVMGLHTAQHNLEVAKRENASILLEEGYQKKYGDYDPNSSEVHILGAVWQSAYLEQSILLASNIQKHAKNVAKRDDRGVKQAGFLVLRETAMPAILVEAGYMTNALEESFLLSDEGRYQIALSIFYGFEDYKRQMEGKKPITHPAYVEPSTPRVVAVNNTQPVQIAKSVPVKSNTPPPAHTSTTVQATQKTVAPPKAPQPVSGDYTGPVRIFLLSWPQRLDRNTGQLGLLSDVQEEIINGQYHYFIGNFAARTEADKMLSEIKNLGFKTAFLAPTR